MRMSSSHSAIRIELGPVFEHGPEDGYASAGKGDERLGVMLSLPTLAIVERLGDRVARGAGAESALEEDALERFVATEGPAPGPAMARLAQDRSQTGRRRHRIGGPEARNVACRGDELGRKNDPHSRQAADEGRIRVAVEQLAELIVEPSEAFLDGEGLTGELARHLGHGRLARYGGVLSLRRFERRFSQSFGVAHAGTRPEMADETFLAGAADLAGGDELGQQVQWTQGPEIQGFLEPRMDRADEPAQPGDAPGLVLDQVAPTPDQDANGDRDLVIERHDPQVVARAHLFGYDAGVSGIGLGLAAGEANARAIDRDAGHVDELETRSDQRGFKKGRDRAHDIQADHELAVDCAQLFTNRVDIVLGIGKSLVDENARVLIDNANPVDVLGDVDSPEVPHAPSLTVAASCAARRAGTALHSHQGHRVISGRTGVAVRPAQQPEPSRTAGMIAIAAPPARHDIGQSRNARQQGKAE